MNDQHWFFAASKVAGGFASIMGLHKSLESMRKWLERRRGSRVQEALRAVHRVYQVLHDNLSDGDRLSVLKCHNGAGLPVPGRTAYTTVSYSVGRVPLQGKWTSIPADSGVAEVLHSALDGFGSYDVRTGMPMGHMRLAARAAGFDYLAIALIRTSSIGTWFVIRESAAPLEKQQFELQTLANEIRSLIH